MRSVDPLADLLAVLDVRSEVTARLDAAGAWAIRFDGYPRGTLKFTALVHGSCWLQVGGVTSPPVLLEPGDCMLLNAPQAYILSSDPALPPVAAAEVFAGARQGHAHYGPAHPGGASARLLGGRVRFAPGAELLLDSLPPVLVVQGGSDAAAVIRWLLPQLMLEATRVQVGALSATTHLAQLLFIQLLRAHLATGRAGQRGWLDAVAHPRLGHALRLMHGDPSHAWTLEALAEAVNMSRSSFATHFKALVGCAPMTYLQRWRMQLAQRALQEGRDSITTIAERAGYTSESAFRHAFKNVVGMPPARYRQTWTASGNLDGKRGQTRAA